MDLVTDDNEENLYKNAEQIFALALHLILNKNEGIAVPFNDEIVAVRKYITEDEKELIVIESYDELDELNPGQWLVFDDEKDEELEEALVDRNFADENTPIVH